MKKRVLYFNVCSLLLSSSYKVGAPYVREVIELVDQFSPEFFEKIRLDKSSIALLNSFSHKTGVLLYPIQQRFQRAFLVAQGFEDTVLAPDAMYRVRRGDMNKINHRIAHAAAIDAEWFVASDNYDRAFLEPYFAKRFIEAPSDGVTSEFIEILVDRLGVKSNET